MSQEIELSTISNELTATLPALSFKGEIVVVDHDEQIKSACRDLMSYSRIGFDTETRPSFKAGVSYKVSLLQLSTPTKCYLFRLNKISFSKEIIALLESEQVVKLGADVAGDIRSITQLHPSFKAGGFIDLQSMIWEWGIGEKSLRKMSALVLGCRISKAQRLSNWEAATLTPQQQLYAATDAWACIEIYEKLLKSQKLSKEEIAQIQAEQIQKAKEAAERKAAKLKLKAKERDPKRRYRRRNRKNNSTKIVENNEQQSTTIS